MGRFTVMPENTFDALQLDAGVLLRRFDIALAASSEDELGFTDDDIICATTGGVNPSCVPSFSDFGEDVDNCPVNMMELKHLDSWECKLSTTSLGTSAELIRLALGCADIEAASSKIVPRADLKQTDFSDLWWVGDKANGGFVAIQIKNALATSGFSLQTTKNGKGQIDLEVSGHVSIKNQKEVPMIFYSVDFDVPTYTVSYNTDGGTFIDDKIVKEGDKAMRPDDPVKAGFDFDGWYADDLFTAEYNWNTEIFSDTTIYAKWVQLFTVTFDTDGGDPVAEQVVRDGGKVVRPTDPTRDPDTFDGWYTDDTFSTPWDFDNDVVTADTTIYAQFI